MTNALINIDVPDIGRAESFYCNVFGLKIARRLGEHTTELEGLGVPCYLLEKQPGSVPAPSCDQRRDYARHWTPVHLDLVIRNIDEVFNLALASGAKKESDIRVVPYGKIAQISDPFGHGFCLIEFNEQGYDAVTS